MRRSVVAAALVIALVVGAYVVVQVLDRPRSEPAGPTPSSGATGGSTRTPAGPTPAGPTPAGPTPAGPTPASTAPAPAPGVPKRPANAQPMTVRYVYDGDTVSLQAAKPGAYVDITKAVKVRLIGVDTPEMTPKKECFAQQATDHLHRLTPVGSTVWVIPDKDSWDNYGRRLFYVWTASGTFVSHDIVAGGWGEAIRVYPNIAQWPLLKANGERARAGRKGLWGAC